MQLNIFLRYDVIRLYNFKNDISKEFKEENNNLANTKFATK
jgi:hypothetical protein